MNLLFLLECALTLSCAWSQPGFSFESTLLRARQVHETSSLPLLIYFSSDDCQSCAQFDALFAEPDILQKMEKHYVSVHVSIDDFDGKACADIYNIRDVPAFVVADHAGVILYKSDENLSVQDIRLLLESVPVAYPSVPKETEVISGLEIPSIPNSVPVPATRAETFQSPATSQRLSDSHLSEAAESEEINDSKPSQPAPKAPVALPSEQNISQTKTTLDPAPIEVIPEAATTPKAAAPVSATARHAYAVQLGFFADKSNASALVARAQQNALTDVRIENVSRDGKSFYRVLAGNFYSLTTAQSFIDLLTSKGMRGAVYRL